MRSIALRSIAAASVAASFVACETVAPVDGTVQGRVMANGSPIPNVTVTVVDEKEVVAGETVTSPANGRFSIGIKPGDLEVRISGFYQVCTGTESRAVTVAKEGTATADFDLDCSGPGPWTAISTGSATCAIGQRGEGWCWGEGGHGALGNGTVDDAMVPVPIAGGISFRDLTTLADHSCGIDDSRLAHCWGANAVGQLGNGTVQPSSIPTPMASLTEYESIPGCALDLAGDAYCWGDNERGQVGDGTLESRLQPTKVVGRFRFTKLAGGAQHNCGLATSGIVWCWGDNSRRQLGIGATTNDPNPDPVMAAGGRTFIDLTSGRDFVCAREASGSVWCWGRNNTNQLGRGAAQGSANPGPVMGGLEFLAITAGGQHACGLVEGTREAYCWGDPERGRLGHGGRGDRPEPVEGGWTFAEIDAGLAHTCARRQNRSTYCWGRNSQGQLGDGTTVDRAVPIRVADQS